MNGIVIAAIFIPLAAIAIVAASFGGKTKGRRRGRGGYDGSSGSTVFWAGGTDSGSDSGSGSDSHHDSGSSCSSSSCSSSSCSSGSSCGGGGCGGGN